MGAKLVKYVKKQQLAEIIFGCFTVTWVFTRCVLFPSRILYSTLHSAEQYIDMFPAYYIFNTLLIILQFLNVMWTVMILRVILDHFIIILFLKYLFSRLHSLP